LQIAVKLSHYVRQIIAKDRPDLQTDDTMAATTTSTSVIPVAHNTRMPSILKTIIGKDHPDLVIPPNRQTDDTMTATTGTSASTSVIPFRQNHEEQMEVLRDAGLGHAQIIAVTGPDEYPDVIYFADGRYGCYEDGTGNFWSLGPENISMERMWEIYGERGRNVPSLQDWFVNDDS
jgi:hypothetical protein